MMALAPGTRRSTAFPLLPPTFALLATLALLLSLVRPAGADKGHWTQTSNWAEGNPARFPVHMVLLPDSGGTFHSRILWWHQEGVITTAPQDSLYGGEWGWTPGNDSCVSFPSSNFTSIGVDTSGMDVFCGAHTMIGGDRRLLATAGQGPFTMEYGDNKVRVYHPGSGSSRGAWTTSPSMQYYRYYPTATTLRDGRAFITAGTAHRQHRLFGGLRSGSTPARPTADTLYRFSPIPNGSWDPSVLPDTVAADGRPPVRYAHTAVQMEHYPFSAHLYFGGQGPQGRLNDTWFQAFSPSLPNELLSDSKYSWVKPPITAGDLPAVRSDHSAIVALGNSMVVFRGLDATSSGLNDVWRFYFNSSQNAYTWKHITRLGGSGPSARLGHSAIYDETVDTTGVLLQRMIVFGGTSAPGQTPTDSKVYELRFVPGDPDTATWYEMTQVDLGGFPSPRYWHTMSSADDSKHSRTSPTDNCHAAIMFGGRLNGSTCSDTLWKLWLLSSRRVGWERVAPTNSTLPGARARHSMVVDPDQSGYGARVYVHGGTKGNGDPADSYVNVFEPWGGKYSTAWVQWNDLGISLAGHTSTLEDATQAIRAAEVYDPASDTWTSQNSATLWEQFYPPQFLVPGGTGGDSRVINIGDYGRYMYSLDVPASGQAGAWTRRAATGFDSKTGVQYLPGRILVTGGTTLTGYTTGLTRTFDTSNLGNSWAVSDSMLPRLNPNLVLLPTGKVLVVGGNTSGDTTGPVKRPQMWDPAGNNGAGTWTSATDASTRLAEQPTSRPYHSTAILLPDGRVLSGGGHGHHGHLDGDQYKADIFCPPYLFKSNGIDLATRPVISDAPASLDWKKVFTICVSDTANITRACLIRPGATTHGFDQNQRHIPLSLTKAGSPNRLFATSPATRDSAPPGYYLLFITGSADGPDVPSIARWVRLGPTGRDTCDAVPADSTNDFAADCDPNVTNGWTLSWGAPGDDKVIVASGPATSYEMRRSSSHITNSNFSSATSMSPPAPATPGMLQTLSTSTSSPRYIRFRTKDDNDQNSGLSDEVYIFAWTSQGFDCSGGEGMMGGGGGGGGSSAGRAPGFAGLRPASQLGIPENSLLPGGRTGEKSVDAWHLPSGSEAVGASYSVRIREGAGHAAALDQVRLVAVDHAAGLEALSVGGSYVLGSRRAASRVSAGSGAEVTAQLDGTETYTAAPEETLSVDLGPGGSAMPLVVEAAGSWPCVIEVLAPDANGGWQSRGRLQPRTGMDLLTLDAPESDAIRLVVIGQIALRFVGSFSRSSEPPTVRSATLASAQSAGLGDVNALVSGSDNLSATLVVPDTLSLSFETPPLESGQARDYFLTVEATPVAARTLAQSQHASGAPLIPTRFALWQNRPNPFNATTTVWFDLPVGAMVKLEVFDAQGRRLGTLANRYFPPGSHAVPWNPTAGGRRIGPGVYFYRIDAGMFRDRKKMTLIP